MGHDRLYGTPGTFWVAVCGACGVGWTLPSASAEQLNSFYPARYSAHVLETGFAGVLQQVGQRLIYGRALARLPLRAVADLRPGDLLDVGCGRGDLGAAFVRRGWRVSGVDPSESACQIARTRGIDTSTGTLESIGYPERSFDALIMNHSLEHVPDPRADLVRAYDLLRPAGLIVVSLPNFACWQRQRFGATWFPLDLPRHRTHFTPGSLKLLLKDVGFELMSLRSASDSGLALTATWQYAIAGRLIITNTLLTWATFPINALLSPLYGAVDRARGGGPVLNAVARRPTA